MNLSQLEALFRRRTGDDTVKYRFSQTLVRALLEEALQEACRRKDLIREADDASLCRISVGAGDSDMIELSPLWTRITGAWWLADGEEEDSRVPLELVLDRQVLDVRSSTWRTTSATPDTVLIERRKARLACLPDTDGELILEGFRLPVAIAANDGVPEIEEVHHRELVHWAEAEAYSIPDTETMDPGRSERARQKFTDHFGPSVDADTRQEIESAPYNRATW